MIVSRRLRLLLSAGLLIALPLFAQKYEDAITVSVVDVPVYVERNGKPITGLTRDDFELFVNGQPQPIEYFDVLDERSTVRGGSSAAPVPAAPLNRRRLVVLLFDTSASSPRALYRARRDASRLVQESRPGQTFAVATINKSGVRFVVPFTNDRVAVQRAIGTMAPSGAADPFGVATLQAERSSWGAVVGGSEAGSEGIDAIWDGEPRGGMSGSGSAGAATAFYRLIEEAEQTEKLIGDEQFVRNLGSLADRMAALDGIKHVVLLSERSSVDGLRRVEGTRSRLSNAFTRLHGRFREAGVILDAVDIRAARAAGGTASSGQAPLERPDLRPSDIFYSLSLDTGGAVTSTLAELEELNRVTYILGFRAAHAKRGSNDIKVRVKNAKLLTEVRYRRTFDLDDDKRGDDALFLADTLLNDIPQQGLTVNLAVHGTWVEASIPGAELLAHPAGAPLPLQAFFYVFDGKGEAVAWSEMRVRVDLAAGRQFLESNPYSIRQQFHLGPGRYAAKVVVRVEGKDIVGFRRTDFEVGSTQ